MKKTIVFVISLLVSLLFCTNVYALSPAMASAIEGYSNEIDTLKPSFNSTINNLKRWTDTYGDNLNIAISNSLGTYETTLKNALNNKNYGLFIDTLCNMLEDNHFTVASVELDRIKTTLVSNIDELKSIETELAGFISVNKSLLATADLFPVINSTELFYNAIYNNVKDIADKYINLFKDDIDDKFDDIHNMNSNDAYNELLKLYNRGLLLETFVNNLQDTLSDWISINTYIGLDTLGFYDVMYDDITPYINKATNALSDRYDNYLTKEWTNLRSSALAIHDDTSKSVTIRNNLLRAKITEVTNFKTKIVNKLNEIKTESTINKLDRYIDDWITDVNIELNSAKRYIESLLLLENYDIVKKEESISNKVIDINRLEKLLTVTKAYDNNGLLNVIKLNNVGGLIKTSGLVEGKIVTGSIIIASDGTKDLISYSVVVKGDVFGKNFVNVNNTRRINAHILGNALNGLYLKAADMTDDGVINVNDTRLLNKVILEGGI